MKCDHCGKTNHTAYKNGKPFCFKLIKALKGSKDDKPDDKSSTKAIRCRYCKNPGHDISECPKLAKKKLNEETGLNHLFIGTIGVNTIETCSCIMKVYDDDSSVDSSIPPPLIQRDDSESEYEYEYDSEYDDDSTVESSVPPLIEPSEDEPAEPKASSYIFNISVLVDVLADSGAAMHVWPSRRTGVCVKTAMMANGSTCEINDIRDVEIKDKLGTIVCLKDAHSVKGVEKRIISINALRKDGWKLIAKGNPRFT